MNSTEDNGMSALRVSAPPEARATPSADPPPQRRTVAGPPGRPIATRPVADLSAATPLFG